MKYFLIAGEASGDRHAADLMCALREDDSEAHFLGLGGDAMREAGCRLFQDYRQMAFMGIEAVLRNLGRVRRNFRIAEKALLAEKPDVLILIDYPSFNLRMAAFCRRHLPATRICYYIPPKVWAWKTYRIHKIATLSDAVLGIFPFEPDFYRRFGYSCTYVGNPTMDQVRRFRLAHPVRPNDAEQATERYIAILPGSRPSEVSHCLPKMLSAARRFPDFDVRVAAAPGIDDTFYHQWITPDTPLVHDTYTLVSGAYAAIVNSGTATLETALLGCPQVAVYHVGCPRLFSLFWRTFFKMRLFTLPNIILGRECIREKLALHFTVEEVADELASLLYDDQRRAQMHDDYELIARTLGDTTAPDNAARIICGLATNKSH